MRERWKNLPFKGKTRALVPVPKVGTSTHGQRQSGTGTIKVVPVPNHKNGLVPVPIKVVPVPILPANLIFCTHALLSPNSSTDSIGTLIND